MGHFVNCAGRETQRQKRTEANSFLGWKRVVAHRKPPVDEAFQDANRLKELEPVTLFKEDLF
jgi:hypothetical protein